MIEFILIFLLYCLIGAIVEFLFVFSVLMYAKRHSSSDEEFIEAWNKASNLIMITSLFNAKNIKQDISSAFQLHIFACMFIWPFHILINILVVTGTRMFDLADRFFYWLTSILIKR